METRRIGGLEVSVVGLGYNNFGGRLDAAATARVVHAALDAGITFLDTGDIYGGTLSEEYMGQALEDRRHQSPYLDRGIGIEPHAVECRTWWPAPPQIERQPRVFVGYLKSLKLAAETPVLVLDGTGALDLNRKIFGDCMTAERFAAPRDAEVFQVSSKTFSRQSITGADRHGNPRSAQNIAEAARLRQQVLELLRLLPGDVLVVTYKAAEEVLLDNLPEHVVSAHFGAVRGLNSFERCHTAVVMGREQPSAQAVEALTRPFTAADAEPFLPMGEYVLQARGRRMRNRGPNVVDVLVHPDLRCQAMLEQVREADIVQAVDRVRPVFNRRNIFVLNNLPLDLTVDHAMARPALRPGKFVHAFGRHGVLPLSGGDLSKAFPDLWPTEGGAAKALERAKKTPDISQIEYLSGMCSMPSCASARPTWVS